MMDTTISHDTQYPLLSVLMGFLTVYLRIIDLTALDKSYFEPFAHMATVCSGATTVILFLLAMYDRIKKARAK